MKYLLLILLLSIFSALSAQDVQILLKEATNLEKTQKEDQAFEKYKQVLVAEPANLLALTKSSELSSSIGGRVEDKKAKLAFFKSAADYADKALGINSNSAEANYARAVAASKLSTVETENKTLVQDVKDTRKFIDRALSIDPDHGKANYVLGKWHYDISTTSWAKKAAFKVLFGGMGDASLDSAYKYMEKSRRLEPYYVQNYLDLAKAYKGDYKPAKAIEVLNLLVKLPVRTADDVALKVEGKQLLAEMQ